MLYHPVSDCVGLCPTVNGRIDIAEQMVPGHVEALLLLLRRRRLELPHIAVQGRHGSHVPAKARHDLLLHAWPPCLTANGIMDIEEHIVPGRVMKPLLLPRLELLHHALQGCHGSRVPAKAKSKERKRDLLLRTWPPERSVRGSKHVQCTAKDDGARDEAAAAAPPPIAA